jgi:hypothetical protein
MEPTTIHQCECEISQARKSPGIMHNHHLMNVFMSRLDEQGRRWKRRKWGTVAWKAWLR